MDLMWSLFKIRTNKLFKLSHIPFVPIWTNLPTSTPSNDLGGGVMFSHWMTNYKDIDLMGIIISKHVVCELLSAVKKGLQAKNLFY